MIKHAHGLKPKVPAPAAHPVASAQVGTSYRPSTGETSCEPENPIPPPWDAWPRWTTTHRYFPVRGREVRDG